MLQITILKKNTTSGAFIGYSFALMNLNRFNLYPVNTWDKFWQAIFLVSSSVFICSVIYAVVLILLDYLFEAIRFIFNVFSKKKKPKPVYTVEQYGKKASLKFGKGVNLNSEVRTSCTHTDNIDECVFRCDKTKG